jgi:hypothetical protein
MEGFVVLASYWKFENLTIQAFDQTNQFLNTRSKSYETSRILSPEIVGSLINTDMVSGAKPYGRRLSRTIKSVEDFYSATGSLGRHFGTNRRVSDSGMQLAAQKTPHGIRPQSALAG